MDILKKTENLDEAVKNAKVISLASLGVALVAIIIAIVGVMFAYRDARLPQVYAVKDYSVTQVKDKRSQVIGHIQMFYRNFFELDQFNYKDNLNRAMNLIGESGYTIYTSYNKDNYYQNLVQLNITSYVDFDSIKVNMEQYPYACEVFGKITYRTKGKTLRKYMNSNFTVREVSNSEKNPYGYMIEDFSITNDDDIPDTSEK